MNGNARVTLSWPILAAGVFALLAVGAGTMYLVTQRPSRSAPPIQDQMWS